MFNSLNSTGMPLSNADIISAQLYSNAGEKKQEYNEKWGNIIKSTNELKLFIDKDIDNNAVLDAVLQQFMYINRAINKEYISKNSEGIESVDVTTPGLRRYYTEIKKELLKEPLNLCDNLTKIIENWKKVKDYAIVKLLLKFNKNAKLFLAGYLYRFDIKDEIKQEDILDCCECLLRLFTLLELNEVTFSSSIVKTFLFKQNVNFVDKNFTIKNIKDEFNEHINKNFEKENVKNAIIDYEKNILVYLNEYIYAKNKGTKFDFDDNVNIEHIMPASGRNLAIIQKDANIDDKDEFKSLVNKIGNKILLEEDINKSISNEWFRTKKQNSIKTKTGYKDSKYNLAISLVEYPSDTWTKNDINKMTQKAADRIVKFIFDEKN
jgi:hypothetical protein